MAQSVMAHSVMAQSVMTQSVMTQSVMAQSVMAQPVIHAAGGVRVGREQEPFGLLLPYSRSRSGAARGSGLRAGREQEPFEQEPFGSRAGIRTPVRSLARTE